MELELQQTESMFNTESVQQNPPFFEDKESVSSFEVNLQNTTEQD